MLIEKVENPSFRGLLLLRLFHQNKSMAFAYAVRWVGREFQGKDTESNKVRC